LAGTATVIGSSDRDARAVECQRQRGFRQEIPRPAAQVGSTELDRARPGTGGGDRELAMAREEELFIGKNIASDGLETARAEHIEKPAGACTARISLAHRLPAMGH
jgi:hypothetical protein